MTVSITAALSSFAQAVSNVGFAVFNASLAVFQAIIALFSEIAAGVLQIGQALVRLATDLVQDTVGFIFGTLLSPRRQRCSAHSMCLQRTSSSFSCSEVLTIGTPARRSPIGRVNEGREISRSHDLPLVSGLHLLLPPSRIDSTLSFSPLPPEFGCSDALLLCHYSAIFPTLL